MSELGPDARSLFEAAMEEDQPSAEDRERVEVALMASVASGAVVANAAGVASSGSQGTVVGGGLLALKYFAAAAVVTAAAAGIYLTVIAPGEEAPAPLATDPATTLPVRESLEATPSPEPAPLLEDEAPAAAAPTDESMPADGPAPREAATPRRPRAASSAEPPSAEATETLVDELRLVRGANVAIRSGEPTRALALLREHAAQHPEGELASERDAALAEAFCASGQLDAGRAAAERFAADYPGSPLRARVLAACPAP